MFPTKITVRTGTRCANPAENRAEYLIDHLASIRQVGVNAKVFGLVWHASQSQRQCQTGYRRALVYSDLIDSTGGTWGSICDSDYSSTLQSISLDLSLILKTQFALEYAPVRETLEVFVDDQLIRDGFKVQGNVLEFDEAPAVGARIIVNYNYATQSPVAEFALREPADSDSLQVYLDGRLSEDFQYNSAERKLVFAQAPQVREIKVTYRPDTKLETRFKLEPDLQSSDIVVMVNGELAPYLTTAMIKWLVKSYSAVLLPMVPKLVFNIPGFLDRSWLIRFSRKRIACVT